MCFHFEINDPRKSGMRNINSPNPGFTLVKYASLFILFLIAHQTFPLYSHPPDILFYKLSGVGSLFLFFRVIQIIFSC